mmetsp:Transcript_2184/g.6532  ORF Transcript_2184/g.6532 Transcript_2184/m.6532 type:complete len:238 (+) Transcript_2184:1008-1721(+)
MVLAFSISLERRSSRLGAPLSNSMWWSFRLGSEGNAGSFVSSAQSRLQDSHGAPEPAAPPHVPRLRLRPQYSLPGSLLPKWTRWPSSLCHPMRPRRPSQRTRSPGCSSSAPRDQTRSLGSTFASASSSSVTALCPVAIVMLRSCSSIFSLRPVTASSTIWPRVVSPSQYSLRTRSKCAASPRRCWVWLYSFRSISSDVPSPDAVSWCRLPYSGPSQPSTVASTSAPFRSTSRRTPCA